MSGRGVRYRGRPADKYYGYRNKRTDLLDFSELKKIKDNDNEEIDAEWFYDGEWQIDDDLALLEDEDWEQWDDWFPPKDLDL